MNDWRCGRLLSTKNKAGGDPVENGSATAERPVWRFDNPVKILFGAGALDEVAGIIGGRRYCLVTYDEPYFKTLSQRVAEGEKQAPAHRFARAVHPHPGAYGRGGRGGAPPVHLGAGEAFRPS